MEQSGYKASGEESVDKYMASSGKAKHKNPLTAESWKYCDRIIH